MAVPKAKCYINYATAEEMTTISGITLEKANEIYALIRKNGNLNKSGFLNLLKQPATRTMLERISFTHNDELDSDEELEYDDGMGEPRDHSTPIPQKSPKDNLRAAFEEIRSGLTESKSVHFMGTEPVLTSKPPVRDSWEEERRPSPHVYQDRPERRELQSRRYREEENGDERRPRNKGEAKLPRNLQFDGKGNWETFFRKFLNFAAYAQWSEKDKEHALMWSLTDKAADYHAMIMARDDDLTFKQQVSRLSNRYGDKELTETSLARFYQASQKVGEELEDWSDRIQLLAHRAFKGLPEEHLNQQAIVRFCQGLLDKRAGEIVCTSRPQTIPFAIDAVKYHQHVHEAMGMERPKSSIRYTYEEDGETAARGAYAVQPDHTRSVQTRDRQRGPQQEVPQASSLSNTTVETTLLKLQETMNKMMLNMSGDRRNRYDPGCFKCGKTDHIKRNCPDLTQADKDRYLNYRRGGK